MWWKIKKKKDETDAEIWLYVVYVSNFTFLFFGKSFLIIEYLWESTITGDIGSEDVLDGPGRLPVVFHDVNHRLVVLWYIVGAVDHIKFKHSYTMYSCGTLIC